MRSLLLIIFLVALSATSAKAEPQEDGVKRKTAKVVAMLKILNIDHPYFTDTAEYISENSREGYVYLADEEIVSGSGLKMQLRYDANEGIDVKNIQLNITEEGSHYNLTGSPNGVMLNYGLKF